MFNDYVSEWDRNVDDKRRVAILYFQFLLALQLYGNRDIKIALIFLASFLLIICQDLNNQTWQDPSRQLHAQS